MQLVQIEMQLQVILVLILGVKFCASIWDHNGRIRKNFNLNSKNILFSITDSDLDCYVKEDSALNTPQLIAKYRYPVEVHHVITKDGYVLELHRIPKPRAVPVLLVHGLFDASSTWVIMGPNKGLSYLLADTGYDVWMLNARGNTYSRKHVTLNPHQAVFWNFSFHEIGIYDLPSTIDYVLQKTNFKRLHYIGHSQGGTTFFIMCSLRPEYNRKIISMQGLAPAVFVAKTKSPFVEILSYFLDHIRNYLVSNGIYEFLPSNDLFKDFGINHCKDGETTQAFCSNFIFLLTGFDKDQINSTMLPVITAHYPAGSSLNQVLHYGQLLKSKRFRQFDYGKMGNLEKYSRKTPPDYDLKKVTAKVAIHYAANDYLTVPEGMERLRQALPDVVGKYLVDFPNFNHIDFVWAIDARELVYYKVINLMKSIEKGNL